MNEARVLALAVLLAACGVGDTIVLGAAEVVGGAGGGAAGAGGSGGQGGTPGADMDATVPPAIEDAALDAEPAPDSTAPDACVASDPLAPILRCTREPRGTSLALSQRFVWPAAGSQPVDLVIEQIPLVANFTDDNADGRVDVCDVPDVLVRAFDEAGTCELYLLSGANGALHRRFATPVAGVVTPAVADLDRDGTVEVITLSPEGQLLILDERGEIELSGETSPLWERTSTSCIAMGVAELDGDDEPEILAGHDVFNLDGTLRFSYASSTDDLLQLEAVCIAALAADVNGDGAQDVVFPSGLVQDSGGDVIVLAAQPGSIRVADVLLGSPAEIVIADSSSLTLLQDGAVVSLFPSVCMSPVVGAGDLDGDGVVDLAFGSCGVSASRLEGETLLSMWQSSVSPSTGLVSAFDLLGDGTAEVVHLSSEGLYVLEGSSGNLRELRADVRTGSTAFGGPVIADVDNDGSADILTIAEGDDGYRLVALGSPAKAFAPVRRIYNQYANQVTHVDENGQIVARPQAFQLSHQNAQIEGDHLCLP